MRDFAELGGLEHLRRACSGCRTDFTDGDLAHLKRCKRLEHLNLTSTGVSNDAIDTILELESLRSLCLVDVNITPNAIEKLKERNRNRDPKKRIPRLRWAYSQRERRSPEDEQSDERETSNESEESENRIKLLNVRGVVVHPNGAPVPGARVVAHTYPGPLEVTSDGQGRFTLQGTLAQLRSHSVLAYSTGGEQVGRHVLPYEVEELRAIAPLRIELKPTVAVRIRVADKEGTPVASAKAGVLADHVWYGHGKTDQQGRATFRIPADATLHNVYAGKSGLGVDYRVLYDPVKQRNNEPQAPPPNLVEPIDLVLEGSKTLRIRVVDEGTSNPISGTRVYLWLTKKPSEPDDLNLSYFANQFAEYTNDDGEAVFDWLPSWEERKSLTFWPSHDDYAQLRVSYDIASGDDTLTVRLPKLVSLGGRVRDPDGRPAAGVSVRVVGEGHSLNSFREETLTNEEGRYRVKAVPNMIYMVVALNSKWGTARDGFALWPGKPLEDVDLTLQPTTRIHGRVTHGDDDHPVRGFRVVSYQFGKHLLELDDLQLPNRENSRTAVQPMTPHSDITDAQGNFEFFVGPGSYDLRGPTQTEVQKFEVTNQEELEVNFHSERPEEGPLEGLVIDAETGAPVASAKVLGIYRHAGRT